MTTSINVKVPPTADYQAVVQKETRDTQYGHKLFEPDGPAIIVLAGQETTVHIHTAMITESRVIVTEAHFTHAEKVK